MKHKLLLSLGLMAAVPSVYAAETASEVQTESDATIAQPSSEDNAVYAKPKKDVVGALSRLTLGGYGEATYNYNFYSDNFNRYSKHEQYKNDPGHGRFDLPHVVLVMGYDFGKGWSTYMEIEFEHGGSESAVEIESEESGEYEAEVERGGEVALEQFWIQKSFGKKFNIRAGHQIIPVGLTNAAHLPTEFFTVFRPEGENTILPCTWHETGVEVWGRVGDWRYEAMLVPGLDSDRFGRDGWIADASGSPYEFKIGNSVAGVFRIDNYSVKGLRIGVSGYVGNSFNNSLSRSTAAKYKDVKGTVSILAADATYKDHNFLAHASFDWGHLTNSAEITSFNQNSFSTKDDNLCPRTPVASDAMSAMVNVGYDFFSFSDKLRKSGQKFYVFGQYDFYDSMYRTEKNVIKSDWCRKNRYTVGVNYYPMKQIVFKAEYSYRKYSKPYNNEPTIAIGVAYSGFFL
jgi:hypothetical protein